jgi:hypothetical protein
MRGDEINVTQLKGIVAHNTVGRIRRQCRVQDVILIDVVAGLVRGIRLMIVEHYAFV